MNKANRDKYASYKELDKLKEFLINEGFDEKNLQSFIHSLSVDEIRDIYAMCAIERLTVLPKRIHERAYLISGTSTLKELYQDAITDYFNTTNPFIKLINN